MQLRVGPSVPRLVSVLAVACQLGVVLTILGNVGLNADVDARLPWALRLWVVGGIVALLALVLVLTADRRGPTFPIALLALLLAYRRASSYSWCPGTGNGADQQPRRTHRVRPGSVTAKLLTRTFHGARAHGGWAGVPLFEAIRRS